MCSGQVWARAALRQLHGNKVGQREHFPVTTMDMTAAIQYILTATQSLGSQVYYKKSRMTEENTYLDA